MKRFNLIVCLAVFVLTGCIPPGESSLPSDSNTIRLMSWNVQNLFNSIDDGTEYSEFDPGKGEWNETLFSKRLDNAGKVIRGAFSVSPDIILLQEIENEDTLNQLKERTLWGLGYKYSACSRGGDRAVQVAVLSRIPILKIIELDAGVWNGQKLRPLQEIHFILNDGEELIVFNNHWKSKSQGVAETEPMRIYTAQILKTRIHVLKEGSPRALIIIAGDLNCDIDREHELDKNALGLENDASVLTLGSREHSRTDDFYFDPWLNEEYKGSYFYDESWERPDHILISPSLLDNESWEFSSFSVGTADFLLNDDGSPKRWTSWSKKGFSDHLPLAVTLIKKGEL